MVVQKKQALWKFPAETELDCKCKQITVILIRLKKQINENDEFQGVRAMSATILPIQ